MSKARVVELLEIYAEGGDTMPWIALVAVIGIGVVLERSVALWSRSRLDVPETLRRVRLRLMVGDVEGAWRACGRTRSPVARVLRAGLTAGPDRWRAEAAVRQVQMGEAPAITRRLTLLSALASIAALLGMLGTVFGLIMGSHCSPETADQRAARIALAIAAAVGTSGFGLLVAIPLLAARLWLGAFRDRLEAEVALYGAKIVSLVVLFDGRHLVPNPQEHWKR